MIPKKEETQIKEESVISVCIKRSKKLMKMRKASISLQAAKTDINACPMRFLNEDSLKDLGDEIKNRIAEFEMSIAMLLKPLLSPHGIILEDKFWFSSDDIRSGYALLRKPNFVGATHVIFLRDMEDTFDGTKIAEGEIKLYKHVYHFLKKLDVEVALKKAQSKSKKKENEQNM